MAIFHDVDHEQLTGVCAYCGEPLQLVEAPDGSLFFDSCFGCDAYDEEEALERLLAFEDVDVQN